MNPKSCAQFRSSASRTRPPARSRRGGELTGERVKEMHMAIAEGSEYHRDVVDSEEARVATARAGISSSLWV